MARRRPVYDVFLSYPRSMAPEAETIASACQREGLKVFRVSEAPAGERFVRSLWEAMSESRALVALAESGASVAPSVAVEIGAASAWNKPVYLVTSAKGAYDVPAYLQRYKVLTMDQVQDLIESVLAAQKPLDEKQVNALLLSYVEVGLPVDQLLLQPALLDKLVELFVKKTEREVSGERLMQELLRRRKGGGLPRLQR